LNTLIVKKSGRLEKLIKCSNTTRCGVRACQIYIYAHRVGADIAPVGHPRAQKRNSIKKRVHMSFCGASKQNSM
jgi:hypothetical protein